MEPFRIRFIDETDGQVDTLQILKVSHANHSPSMLCSIDCGRQSNLCRERKIFVKAALQLIDSHEVASAFTSNNDGGVDAKFDVIRSGVLMKGVRSASLISSMGLSSHKVSSTGSFTWKSKYVELRHGQFAYYDDASEDSTPLMGGSLHSYHPNFNNSSSAYKGSESHRKVSAAQASAALSAIKKVIPLYVGSCTCRSIRLSQHHRGHSGDRGASNSSSNGFSSTAKTLVPLTPGNNVVDSNIDGHHRRDSNPELVGAEPAAHSSSSVGAGTHMTGTEGHAFEICQLGGQRRLFLAGSAEECARWVRAINVAMISNAAAVVGADGDTDSAGVLQAAGKQQRHQQVNSDCDALRAGSASVEGAAGPYATDIARFIQLQQRLHGAEREEDCRGALQDMISRHVEVRVPVAYIKGKCADSRFAKAATTSAASPITTGAAAQGDHRIVHTHMGLKHWIPSGLKKQQSQLGSTIVVSSVTDAIGQQKARENVNVEHSQMWKDLQRDEVSVNGEKVAGNNDTAGAKGYGEQLLQDEDCYGAGAAPQLATGGAEAIVGLLVRHIADAAEQARTEFAASLLAQQMASSSEGDKRITSNKVAPNIQGMSESHMVQCARSILMMCNRTQSGGDTYYCVDSLLSKKLVGGDNLFILAPVSNKAEPLTIIVDVVEVIRNRAQSQRNSGKNTAVLCSHQQVQRQKLLNAGTEHKQATGSVHEGFTTPDAPAAPLSSYIHTRENDSPCNDFIDALAASTAAALSVDSPLASTAKPNAMRERETTLPPGALDTSGVPALNLGDAACSDTANSGARRTGKGVHSKPVSARNPQLFARRDLPPPPVAASLGVSSRFDLTGAPAVAGASGPATPPGALTKSPSTKIWEVRPGRSPRRIGEPSPPSAQVAADSKGESLVVGTGPDGPMLRRRSSRKSQLKLSIDDEVSYCDSGPSSGFQAQMQSAEQKTTSTLNAAAPAQASASVSLASKALRSDFAVILQRHSSTGSGQSDADSTARLNLLDETGDADDENTACEGEGRGADAFRESNDTVPVSIMCLQDEHRLDGSGTTNNISVGKDDSTVISDITFDTTAAFSQNTSVASYLKGHEPQIQASQVDGMLSVEKGTKTSGSHKPKSLLKLLASRLTPSRHQRGTSTASSVPGSPALPQTAFTPSRPTDKHVDDGDSITTAPRYGAADTIELRSEQRGAGNYHRGSKSAYKPTPTGHTRSKLVPSTITEGTHDSEHLSWKSGSSESGPAEEPAFCIRLRVQSVSRYRVCSADPQGVPEQDNWATMVGVFSQTFFVPAVAEVAALPHLFQHEGGGNSSSSNTSQHGSKHVASTSMACKLGKLAMTDRLVTISTEAFEDESPHY